MARRAGRLLGLLVAGLVAACAAPQFVPPGEPIMPPKLEDDAVLAADGARLPLRCWMPEEPPRGMILALHGFNDYANFFDGAGRFLAERGILSYAYDQRGFGAAPNTGRWAGTDAYVDDLIAAARLLRARHPDLPFYLLGESMGAAILMVAMTGPDAPAADGLILSAPAIWARPTWPFYQRWGLWLFTHAMPGLTLTGRGVDIRATDNDAVLKAMQADPLVIKGTRMDTIWGLTELMNRALAAARALDDRALILYGVNDEVIPGEPFAMMARALPEAARGRQVLAFYETGYHMLMRDLRADLVLADVVAWIEAPEQPLPSAADLRGRLRLER